MGKRFYNLIHNFLTKNSNTHKILDKKNNRDICWLFILYVGHQKSEQNKNVQHIVI